MNQSKKKERKKERKEKKKGKGYFVNQSEKKE